MISILRPFQKGNLITFDNIEENTMIRISGPIYAVVKKLGDKAYVSRKESNESNYRGYWIEKTDFNYSYVFENYTTVTNEQIESIKELMKSHGN
jgi:hypothetical protein